MADFSKVTSSNKGGGGGGKGFGFDPAALERAAHVIFFLRGNIYFIFLAKNRVESHRSIYSSIGTQIYK